MKRLLTACLLTTALCGASHAEVLFDFKNDAALYSALSGKTGPVTVTNSGLIATFTTTNGTMNRTTSGFGINASIAGDDTDGFDGAEWIDITFESAVTLSNVTVGSWNAGVDQAIIYVGGVSNGAITSTGGHDFDIRVPTGQLLRIVSTAGIVTNNGWSLDSLIVEPDAPPANLAPILGVIGDKSVILSNSLNFAVSATDGNGDLITLSASNLPDGAVFTTITNAAAVTNTFTWTDAAPTGTYFVTFFADDGTTNTSETISISVDEAPILPESITFDFLNDADLYGALDDQAGPITYTNEGVVATFATANGEMNRTTSGFGINTSGTAADDPDGFDTNEWLDITFEIPIVLTNISVGSWNAGADQAVVFVNGISNGVITTRGNTPLDILVLASQTLRIAATNGVLNNGWSLNSITVRTDTNAPPSPNILPAISLAIPSGGPITLAWPAGEGSAFHVLTNGNLLNVDGWANANLVPFLDGDSYKVTNSIGSDPALFYKLESQ